MKRFAQLYTALDSSNRSRDKHRAIVDYFKEAPAEDAAWCVYFLLGNRLGRLVSGRALRELVAELTHLPEWLVEASYAQVGDLAETLALLMEGVEATLERQLPSLHQLVAQLKSELGTKDVSRAGSLLPSLWAASDNSERLVLNKLLTGGLRVGVSRATVVKALAEVAQVEPAVMAHRLMGGFEPTAENFKRLFIEASQADAVARPYPFCLAYPVDEAEHLETSLGALEDWQVEWKWDGIRAQLLYREADPLLWSRGEELVGDAFPEIVESARILPKGIVLDGEIVAWDEQAGRPLPFGALQRRIGRKRVSKALLGEVPVRFVAYDLLESESEDRRGESTLVRRRRLEVIFAKLEMDSKLGLSPVVESNDWRALEELRAESRARAVEGFMLKHKQASYRVGRVRGDWWKWKIEPYTLDAVLVNAIQGHGRRAGLYTDYTFALRDGDGGWVPFAKAYSGLTDAEIRQVDTWIRRHTLERHGPVRIVEPTLVFEIAFEGIAESKRHKCGLAVRFPRIHRWRQDKSAREADDLSALQRLHRLAGQS